MYTIICKSIEKLWAVFSRSQQRVISFPTATCQGLCKIKGVLCYPVCEGKFSDKLQREFCRRRRTSPTKRKSICTWCKELEGWVRCVKVPSHHSPRKSNYKTAVIWICLIVQSGVFTKAITFERFQVAFTLLADRKMNATDFSCVNQQ
jgi:hypothetical protein